KLAQLTLEQRRKGVVTASSGNHAQGVAFASRMLEIPATIFVPETVSTIKLHRLQEYDVEIIQEGDYDEVEPAAREFSKKRDLVYVSPYNDYDVMAGQGTIAIEVMEILDRFDRIVVPVGGGGLIAGISTAVKAESPSTEVLGVVTPGASTLYHSFRAGKIIEVEEFETIAEAFLGGLEDDSRTFQVIMDSVDDILMVQEDSVKDAMKLLWSEKGQVVEGAGATGVALILEQPQRFHKKRVVAVISGGNISQSQFQDIVRNSLTE
ncbi:threonine/serine dehydratase, partial [Candidatus Thorarchaeota archaeon]